MEGLPINLWGCFFLTKVWLTKDECASYGKGTHCAEDGWLMIGKNAADIGFASQIDLIGRYQNMIKHAFLGQK